MLTQFHVRRTTTDIDVFLKDVEDSTASSLYQTFKTAASIVARRKRIPKNWINDVIGDFLRDTGNVSEGILWRTYAMLEVFVLPGDYILALKLLAGRQSRRMKYMSLTLHVPAAWLAMTAVATVFVIVYPFILGVVARKKLAVGWKYFWFGALVFLVFQLVTRVPLVLVLQQTLLAPLLRSSTAFTWTWLVILAVLLHALIDFLTLAFPQAFGHSASITLLNDGMLGVFGLLGVWIIWRLREPEETRVGEEITHL